MEDLTGYRLAFNGIFMKIFLATSYYNYKKISLKIEQKTNG